MKLPFYAIKERLERFLNSFNSPDNNQEQAADLALLPPPRFGLSFNLDIRTGSWDHCLVNTHESRGDNRFGWRNHYRETRRSSYRRGSRHGYRCECQTAPKGN